MDIAPHSENFVDEVDVSDTSRDQAIHFLQDGVHISLAIFIAEQGLVTEGASPGAASREFQFGAASRALEHMMTMIVMLHAIVVERSERAPFACR